MTPPSIIHNWEKILWLGPWKKEDVVNFVLEIEERVARGGSSAADIRPRFSLVPGGKTKP